MLLSTLSKVSRKENKGAGDLCILCETLLFALWLISFVKAITTEATKKYAQRKTEVIFVYSERHALGETLYLGLQYLFAACSLA